MDMQILKTLGCTGLDRTSNEVLWSVIKNQQIVCLPEIGYGNGFHNTLSKFLDQYYGEGKWDKIECKTVDPLMFSVPTLENGKVVIINQIPEVPCLWVADFDRAPLTLRRSLVQWLHDDKIKQVILTFQWGPQMPWEIPYHGELS